MNSDQTKARAEAAFKKEQRVRDGTKAWAEHEAAARATLEKTTRLRALRLAKESAEKTPAGAKKTR